MKWNFSCYDCEWLTDKCKNTKCNKYDKFPENINECNIAGKVDNSLGCSFSKLKDADI